MMTTTPKQSTGWARTTALYGALALAGVLAGCASGPHTNPRDPYEGYNRSMTRFNDGVDEAVLKPVATLYKEVTPSPVRTGVSNFFSNLGDLWSSVNSVLQLRAEAALDSFVRFNVNTVFGIGGLFDVASEMGIDRNKQDFGLTLGRWGVPSGPYLVLPLLGPSTVRDTVALPVDWMGDITDEVVTHVPTRNSLYALRVVDRRASLLGAGSVLESAALDKYAFTRDVYMQLRNQHAAPASLDADDADDGGGKLPPEPN
jgi:phospholipid-binding lipoprotein MlaA